MFSFVGRRIYTALTSSSVSTSTHRLTSTSHTSVCPRDAATNKACKYSCTNVYFEKLHYFLKKKLGCECIVIVRSRSSPILISECYLFVAADVGALR
jgi:hypothetical protein